MYIGYAVGEMTMSEDSDHYKLVVDYKGPLNAAFEIDGEKFVTDRPTLELLNSKRDHGSLRIAAWLFAVNLATGRIRHSPHDAAGEN